MLWHASQGSGVAVRIWWNTWLYHLLCSLHAADNTGCFHQDQRARVDAFAAKRKAYMVGYSLVSLQRYAAKQVSKKHQLCSAHHLHCLNVQLEAFAAWRCFLQVRFPFVWWLAAGLQCVVGMRVQRPVLESCCITMVHLPSQSTLQPVMSCFADH